MRSLLVSAAVALTVGAAAGSALTYQFSFNATATCPAVVTAPARNDEALRRFLAPGPFDPSTGKKY